MDYAKLQLAGAIVPRSVFKREIEVTYHPPKPESDWAEPGNPEFEDDPVTEKWPVFLRLPSAADALEIAGASDRDRPFVGIYRCWVKEDGTEFLPSLEDATSIRPWLALPLWNAISAMNPANKRKKSRPTKNGGASSPSSSAAAR